MPISNISRILFWIHFAECDIINQYVSCWHICSYTWVTGREPLTYYDMNLSAQDHQTFFTCDTDHLRPADASKRPCEQLFLLVG